MSVCGIILSMKKSKFLPVVSIIFGLWFSYGYFTSDIGMDGVFTFLVPTVSLAFIILGLISLFKKGSETWVTSSGMKASKIVVVIFVTLILFMFLFFFVVSQRL